MADIINGTAIAKTLRQAIKKQIDNNALSPALAILLANDLDASTIYVRRKMTACEEVGIKPILYKIDPNTPENDIINLVQSLNNDSNIHGIFLQLPTYSDINSHKIIQSINPEKDVDGLTVHNMGLLISGSKDGLIPCTPQGVMELLHHQNIDLTGKHAVIIGRSLLFGKPMGQLLLQENCTVTQCHSKTKNMEDIARQADILISATGQAKMVKANWVKNGAVIIDVGISKLADGSISGDVDFDDVKDIASQITPVPGGVGPMTVACLLGNTVKAATQQK